MDLAEDRPLADLQEVLRGIQGQPLPFRLADQRDRPVSQPGARGAARVPDPEAQVLHRETEARRPASFPSATAWALPVEPTPAGAEPPGARSPSTWCP